MRELREHPFITLVVHEDSVVIYVKGMDNDAIGEAMRRINGVTVVNDEES